MQQAPNRNEILRDVKTILVKYAVDLQKCFFSCSTDIITLYGSLKKSPRGNFTVSGVMALCRELKAMPSVRDVIFRLENWAVDSTLTSVVFLEKRKHEEEQGEEAEKGKNNWPEKSVDQRPMDNDSQPFDDAFI